MTSRARQRNGAFHVGLTVMTSWAVYTARRKTQAVRTVWTLNWRGCYVWTERAGWTRSTDLQTQGGKYIQPPFTNK